MEEGEGLGTRLPYSGKSSRGAKFRVFRRIVPTKYFVMRMRKGKGGSTLRTVRTGSRMALYRYFSSAMDNLPDPKGPLSKEMHTYVAPVARCARPGYENGRGSIKNKRENENHENFF